MCQNLKAAWPRCRFTLDVKNSHGSLAAYLWSFVPDGKSIQTNCEAMADVPITCAGRLYTPVLRTVQQAKLIPEPTQLASFLVLQLPGQACMQSP